MAETNPRIGVLGASGLIGHAVVIELQQLGCDVVALARRFSAAQVAAHRVPAQQLALADLDERALSEALRGFDIVVNCLGVLQDAPGSSTDDIHVQFVMRLTRAIRSDALLAHVSVPQAGPDATAFSRSKRAAEAGIVASGNPYLILRPGFVIADAAFGGSALMRALAATPLALPPDLAATPFAVTDVRDITATVAFAAESRGAGRRDFAETWDVFSDETPTVGSVLESLRQHQGGPRPRVTAPRWLLAFGALAGDIASYFGWVPPVRSTALKEMARGMSGDPTRWRQATGIRPRALREILAARPATVQEQWFAKMFLLKPLVIGGLALFWIISGLIALFPALAPAITILVGHGVPSEAAGIIAVVTSLVDIALGVGIAVRRTSRGALVAALAVAASYVAGAIVLAPELWLDPVGSMVKTIPVIILMLVALAVSDNR